MPPPYKRRTFISNLKQKGFEEGESTKHGMLELTDEHGDLTGIKISVIGKHVGIKGDVTMKIIGQVSSKIGVDDKQFVCDLVDCPATHADLLARLRALNKI